ncbi:MAG: hypothetical protein AAB341_03585 [Planctomycetota bacterium]
MKVTLLTCVTATLLLAVGCKEPPTPSKDHTTSAAKKDDSGQAKSAKHDDHDDHADHKHGEGAHGADAEHAHHDPGKQKCLGTVKIGVFDVKVIQETPVAAGKEGSFHIELSGGRVKAVRTWIGAGDAKGSVKAKAEKEGDAFHAHPETPDPLPAGSALWIELDTETGETLKGSIKF